MSSGPSGAASAAAASRSPGSTQRGHGVLAALAGLPRARSRSVSRREATVISQPRGLSGTPSSGHCLAAAISASWTASSAVSKCP